jgi:hypothetical protein
MLFHETTLTFLTRLSEPRERRNLPQEVKVRPWTLPWWELPASDRSFRLLYLHSTQKIVFNFIFVDFKALEDVGRAGINTPSLRSTIFPRRLKLFAPVFRNREVLMRIRIRTFGLRNMLFSSGLSRCPQSFFFTNFLL